MRRGRRPEYSVVCRGGLGLGRWIWLGRSGRLGLWWWWWWWLLGKRNSLEHWRWDEAGRFCSRICLLPSSRFFFALVRLIFCFSRLFHFTAKRNARYNPNPHVGQYGVRITSFDQDKIRWYTFVLEDWQSDATLDITEYNYQLQWRIFCFSM